MMTKGNNAHPIAGVFVFLLLGIFAVFSTLMVLTGAKAYRGTVDRSDAHNRARIASSYIRSMLRADDGEGTLQIEDLDGIRAITLMNTYDDESYATRIYVYDGMLRELFTDAAEPFDPEWGEPVCEAEALSAEFLDGLLHVTVTAGGTGSEIFYAPRTAVTEGA